MIRSEKDCRAALIAMDGMYAEKAGAFLVAMTGLILTSRTPSLRGAQRRGNPGLTGTEKRDTTLCSLKLAPNG
jgi:hypothetical protein